MSKLEKERSLELLQNCIDYIVLYTVRQPSKLLIDELGFTKKELLEFGFPKNLFNDYYKE